MNTDRRQLVIKSAVVSGAAIAPPFAWSVAGPVTSETDPKAMELGYKADAGRVDTAKYPKFAPGQRCGNCASYQGRAGIAAGPCPRMPKPVMAAGWCSAYVKAG